MRIRDAEVDDSAGISELICELSEMFITKGFSPQGKEFLLGSMTPDSIKKYMQSGYRYHVAEMEGRLIGVVAVRGNTHLYHLFVAEQYQRRGIAEKLWQFAMEVCLANGNPGEFTVNSSEYALGVYKQFGFVAQSAPQEHKGVVFFPMKLEV